MKGVCLQHGLWMVDLDQGVCMGMAASNPTKLKHGWVPQELGPRLGFWQATALGSVQAIGGIQAQFPGQRGDREVFPWLSPDRHRLYQTEALNLYALHLNVTSCIILAC